MSLTSAQIARHARHIEKLSNEVAASLYCQLVIVYPGDPIVDQASVLSMVKNSSSGRAKLNKFLVEARQSLCPLSDFGPAPIRPDLGPEPLQSSLPHLTKIAQAQEDPWHRRFLDDTGYPGTALWKAQRAATHGLHVSEYDFDSDYPLQMYVDHHGELQMTRWALSWYDKYPATLAGESAEIKQIYRRGDGKPRMQIVGTITVMDRFRNFSEHGWVPASFLDTEEDRNDREFLYPAEYLE